MKARAAALALVVVLPLVSARAMAEVVPAQGDGDPRLRTVRYSAQEVVKLTAAVGFQIHLEFGAGESFVNLAAGDTGAVDVGSIANHVMLKPKVTSGHTNLVILTSRRVYHFDYRIVATPDTWSRVPSDRVMWSVRFEYPEDAKPEPKAAPKAEAAAGAVTRNLDYAYRGVRSLKPTRVEDDGKQTRFVFGDNAEIPAIFARDEAGEESLVNFHVDAGGLVVHSVAREFVVRRGKLVACIVNSGFVSAGGGR